MSESPKVVENTHPSGEPADLGQGVLGGLRRLLIDPTASAEHDERFRALVKEHGGEYLVDKELDRSRAVFRMMRGEHTLSLSAGTTVVGRAVVPFTDLTIVFPDRAEIGFRVGREGVFERIIAGLFQIRDHFDGESDFDRLFLVTGNDGFRVRAIFTDRDLQQLMCAEPDVAITTFTDEGFIRRAPDGKRAVLVHLGEEVRELGRLSHLIRLGIRMSDMIGAVNTPEER